MTPAGLTGPGSGFSSKLPPPPMKVFASTGSYLLGRMIGSNEACAAITRIAATGAAPVGLEGAHVPGALTIHELAKHYDVTLKVDGESVCIGKSRSRALADAIESAADVWLTVDDDVFAAGETLRWLVDAVTRDEAPRVCIVPCPLRNEPSRVNVEWAGVYLEDRLPRSGRVRRAKWGGFGLVAMNRAAMLAASNAAPSFRDHDGRIKAAAFLELVTAEGRWLGEDISFFERLPRSVTVDGLITGSVAHGSHKLDLTKANL